MAWHLDIKGFHVSGSSKSGVCDFTAIVPVWDDISRHYGVYPINHVRIGGVAVPPFLFFDLLDARWHPDSPFYEENGSKLYSCFVSTSEMNLAHT